jgi:pilus assembly protein Flp/PilA
VVTHSAHSGGERRTKNHTCIGGYVREVHTQREDTMIDSIKKFIRDEEGQDLVEYALLLVFLALAAIAILPTLGSSVNRVFSQSNSTLNAS